MTFRIVGDTIEYEGVTVAEILPGAWPTLRDDLEQALDGYNPSSQETIAELEYQLGEAKRDNETLRDEKEALEDEIDKLENALDSMEARS